MTKSKQSDELDDTIHVLSTGTRLLQSAGKPDPDPRGESAMAGRGWCCVHREHGATHASGNLRSFATVNH